MAATRAASSAVAYTVTVEASVSVALVNVSGNFVKPSDVIWSANWVMAAVSGTAAAVTGAANELAGIAWLDTTARVAAASRLRWMGECGMTASGRWGLRERQVLVGVDLVVVVVGGVGPLPHGRVRASRRWPTGLAASPSCTRTGCRAATVVPSNDLDARQ